MAILFFYCHKKHEKKIVYAKKRKFLLPQKARKKDLVTLKSVSFHLYPYFFLTILFFYSHEKHEKKIGYAKKRKFLLPQKARKKDLVTLKSVSFYL